MTVPPNIPIFVLGLALGTVLLVLGLLLGFWLGRKSVPTSTSDRQHFVAFLRNLSHWTSELSGDVGKYQSMLTRLSDRVQNADSIPREEVAAVLTQIMQANAQLQQRLDSTEHKLDVQSEQISNYLTEARTDGLTGLLNRRAFDKATDELFAGWQKKAQSFCLGLVDIDHFKHINDTFGHPAGDAVLMHIAETLQSELRESVCVARYGGEEFAVLSTAPCEELAAALEHLRTVVSKVEVRHENNLLSVTISGGVSQIQSGDKIGLLVRRADEALYAAKSDGRNCIFVQDGSSCLRWTPHSLMTNTTRSDPGLSQAQPIPGQHARIQERLKRIVEEETQRIAQR